MDAGVYYVTGGLGSGKSSVCVSKIRDALNEGRRVATNLDLNLEHLVGPWAKKTNVLRIPDHPTIEDLDYIGEGYYDQDPRHYDESQFGLLVLDELGTWFNSREWNKPGRREVVNWLLHARKRRWILLLIIQDLELLDSQAKAATAKDFVVYCRNLGKYTMPLIGPLWKFVTGSRLALPTVHLAVVKNGFAPGALVADRWWYSTKPLRAAYNTRQLFISRDAIESTGLATMLPPWWVAGRHIVKKDWGYWMAQLRARSEWGVLVGAVGLLFGVLSFGFVLGAGLNRPVQASPAPMVAAATVAAGPSVPSAPVAAPKPEPKSCEGFDARFSEYRYTGSYGERAYPILFLEGGGRVWKSFELEREGYTLTMRGNCAVEVSQSECRRYVYCGPRQAQAKPVAAQATPPGGLVETAKAILR